MTELYEILRLRQTVFGIEQQCLYQDLDGLDPQAAHLTGWQETGSPDSSVPGRLVAGLRILAPGVRYDEPSIGRVLVDQSMRGQGCGRALMREGIERCQEWWPALGIRISAQQYLIGFYESLGFTLCSPPYDEDGITHVQMVRSKNVADPANGPDSRR